MQLIFLFKDNVPTLVPKSACKYNKALDIYESQIPGLMLTVPAERYNPEFQFRYLYKAVFDRYCVATNVVLGYNIIFLFGKSSDGIGQYVVCSIRDGDLRNVIAYGLMLRPGTIISAGSMTTTRSLEDHTFNLFEILYKNIQLTSDKQITRQFRIDFFNDQGDCFGYRCKGTTLNSVSVDYLGNTVYVMNLT
ncbi:hypothetical protein [Ehrlichia canis]|uniref:hypothetical protein n=1 Tax=Ehrlichia canis TaxID=944 RepID=UPI0012DB7B04|nr:hypothetical protein [Ehrlichia canis]UKC53613.1 hypothetical protein s20019040002_000656 [Ehrlichia canis]UKC54551.1 hypothetical protein s20026770001_000657 [Ehrlichia canis]UKC55487.1 hypothetical protein s21009500007_000657 [Ehrlichia canis]